MYRGEPSRAIVRQAISRHSREVLTPRMDLLTVCESLGTACFPARTTRGLALTIPTQRPQEAAMLSPVRRSRRRVLSAQPTSRWSLGHHSASAASSGEPTAPVSMGRAPRRRVAVWDDLDAVEQSLLAVAAREHTLDGACASWAAQPLRRGDIEMTVRAAGRLHQLGLIGFYRIADGYPDLCDPDLQPVLNDPSQWECGNDTARRVGLYLTTSGEDLVLGP